MNFGENVVLREHYSFLVADAQGKVDGGERGLYNRDTRMLSRYAWSWRCAQRELTPLVVDTPRPDTMNAHYALIEGPSQLLAVSRTLTIEAAVMRDELELANTSLEPLRLDFDLRLAADFCDLFEARGWPGQQREPATIDLDGAVTFAYTASDGVLQEAAVSLGGGAPALTREEGGVRASWSLELAPGEQRAIKVTVGIDNPLDRPPTDAVSYERWRGSFGSLWELPSSRGAHRPALERAVDDMRGLLLFT